LKRGAERLPGALDAVLPELATLAHASGQNDRTAVFGLIASVLQQLPSIPAPLKGVAATLSGPA